MKKKAEWKPEYKFEQLSGSFVDYRGELRSFTMVAVSIPLDDAFIGSFKKNRYWQDEKEPCYNDTLIPIYKVVKKEYIEDTTKLEFKKPLAKMLSIGVAVRCVRDKENGLGTRIAYGKAVKLMDHTLYVTHPGMINTKMVKALLEQEAEKFRENPGSYLKGYDSDMKRYNETGIIAESEMTEKEYAKHKESGKGVIDALKLIKLSKVNNETVN